MSTLLQVDVILQDWCIENINLVIQINGKKREILNTQRDLDEDEILKIIDNNVKLKKYIENKKIVKKIFVKNKIVNLIVK